MPRVRVNDIEMYYETHGKGTPLVHIGGLAGDARTWTRQIEHLAQYFQVLCFDNRGTGRTDCPDRPYSTKLFADDTVGLMDAVGIERAHIYGISMGGGNPGPSHGAPRRCLDVRFSNRPFGVKHFQTVHVAVC
jgi:3-oxoadipate enol-lactonase